MKTEIHPTYQRCTVTCGSCGATFETGSTLPEIRLELCSKCHPFFTGQQRIVDSGGRVEQFKRRYGIK